MEGFSEFQTVELNSLLKERKEELFFYSPYSFLRKIAIDELFHKTIETPIKEKISKKIISFYRIRIRGSVFLFLTEFLEWDSIFFEIPSYKLHSVLYKKSDAHLLTNAVKGFKSQFFSTGKRYLFIEIPSEDIVLIQALGASGFRLIETRMTYYLELDDFSFQRFSVRQATSIDILNLKRVAREMRNPFDRFHADPVFDQEKADEFLATYIEESIKGFADCVIVPNEAGIPPDAFVTAKYLKDEWPVLGVKVSKMVLSAVSSKTCKGWYKKLISEMAFHLKEIGTEYAFMHPASTNRAVISTYETLGCRLGQVSHIFSIY